MARKTVLVSDISGDEIADGNGATLTISYSDARRGIIKLDVSADEVSDLASKGQKQARRGRPPKPLRLAGELPRALRLPGSGPRREGAVARACSSVTGGSHASGRSYGSRAASGRSTRQHPVAAMW